MNGAPLSKRIVARALDRVGVLQLDLATRGVQAVLAIGYHGTPERSAHQLDRHFALYRERFQCLGEDDMLGFVAGGLRLRKTGIAISFDDGDASNAQVAAPLLERHGLRGWFMLPGAFLDEPGVSQPDYFKQHIRPGYAREPVHAMTWEAARTLAAHGHAVGCHTWTHQPLGPDVSADMVQDEVVAAKGKLEQRLERKVRTFCWARGRPGDYSAGAHRAIVHSYELALTTLGQAVRPGASPHAIHRFNVEACDSLSVVRFQIGRLNELAFSGRRTSVTQALSDRGAT